MEAGVDLSGSEVVGLLEKPGGAICRGGRKAETRRISGFCREALMGPENLQALVGAWGFCANHAGAVNQDDISHQDRAVEVAETYAELLDRLVTPVQAHRGCFGRLDQGLRQKSSCSPCRYRTSAEINWPSNWLWRAGQAGRRNASKSSYGCWLPHLRFAIRKLARNDTDRILQIAANHPERIRFELKRNEDSQSTIKREAAIGRGFSLLLGDSLYLEADDPVEAVRSERVLP